MIKLKIISYKKAVVLKVDYEATAFTEELFNWKWCKGKEIFRFDIESGKSTFFKQLEYNKAPKVLATYPLNLKFSSAILNESILRFFRSNCLGNKTHRSALVALMRLLRETVNQIMEREKGIELGTTYINAFGHAYGMFLVPMINIANRIENPSMANLSVYTEFKGKIPFYMWPENTLLPENWLTQLDQLVENGNDNNTAVIKLLDLPNKDLVRSMIEINYLCVFNLKAAFEICSNYDFAIRLFKAVQITEEIKQFINNIKPIYGEEGIVRLAEKSEEYNLEDCVRLYNCLNNENIELLIKERVRIRNLHDWLSITHKKQQHKNVKFNVPEHVIRRLSMQMNGLSFSLPSESLELIKVGHDLHNCVASYSEDMANNKCWIVIITNDDGKRLACLEISENALVQARINKNIGVKENRDINDVVMQWVRKANLAVKTKDINDKVAMAS